MTKPQRALAILDIDEVQEQVYRWLLAHPASTAQAVAVGTGLGTRAAQRVLDTIERKGLATYSPQRPRRYLAASPAIAMEALVLAHQDALEHVRIEIQQLQKKATTAVGEQEQIVELLNSMDAVSQAYAHIQRAAQQEVISLARPPILISRFEVAHEIDQADQLQAKRRGVVYRTIADAAFLALPGAVARVRDDASLGETYRTVAALPFKLLVADRRIGLIPMSVEVPDGPSLLLRSSALLDALCTLFELLWQQATPLDFNAHDQRETGRMDTAAPHEFCEFLSLLAAGLPDKVIADQLDISGSTFSRRLAEVMEQLGARTRFQLGWLAARHVDESVARRRSRPAGQT